MAGLYALTLPHTPPAEQRTRVFAPARALGLLRDPSLRALLMGAALSATCMQFHFILWPLFFTDQQTGLGFDVSDASIASSVAQGLEVLLFPLLGWLLRRFGLRWVLLAGTAAWPLRYFVYVLGDPAWLVVSVQLLHGINVVCGVVTAQIAIDRVAAADARASSQALLTASTTGFGNLLGQLLCGAALSVFAVPGGGQRWPLIYAIPLALGALATLTIALGFRPARHLDSARPLAVEA
jgi:hypothetical protein